MPAPFTVFNPASGRPLATFDDGGDLYLAGTVTTDGAVSTDGQTVQPGTPGGGGGGGGASGTYMIYEADGSYPLRETAGGAGVTVIWIGPDAPTIGSGYALNGVDLWIPATVT